MPGDWPNQLLDFSGGMSLSTAGLGCPAAEVNRMSGGQFNLTGNFAAKVVCYIPVAVAYEITVYQLGIINGATISGNIDVGIMDALGTRLVSSGSTAQTGTSAAQTFDVADTVIGPGTYYLALSQDNATGLVNRSGNFGGQLWRACGCRTETTGTFGIPATATFAAYGTSGFPLIVAAVAGATF